MDPKAYESLKKVYADSFGKLYERNLKYLFDVARGLITGKFYLYKSIFWTQ